MDEGQTNNPNVNSSRYQMKFWGLHAMVTHIANTMQHNHKDNTTNHNVPIQRASLSLILMVQDMLTTQNISPSIYPMKVRVWLGWLHVQCAQCNKTS